MVMKTWILGQDLDLLDSNSGSIPCWPCDLGQVFQLFMHTFLVCRTKVIINRTRSTGLVRGLNEFIIRHARYVVRSTVV